VLLCDEPTSSVDAENQAAIIALLRAINREKKISILFTSHDRLQAAGLADRILVLEHGRLVHNRYENIFICTVNRRPDGRLVCTLGAETFWILAAEPADLQPGKQRISLDPAALELLTGDAVPPDDPGCLRGRVMQLMDEGDRVRLVVNTGVMLTLLLPRRHYRNLAPKIGDRVGVRIPADAVLWQGK
jgi:tungstate transport system ATP-binding protein